LIVRVNDGNDSNVQRELVIASTSQYDHRFFNTSIPQLDFPAPVVLTVNPGRKTDVSWHRLEHIPKNLMFVRIRTNTWNLDSVVDPAVQYYTTHPERGVPVVLTFMAYFRTEDEMPPEHRKHYVFRRRTTNDYMAITTEAWREIMKRYQDNGLVYSCGKIEGEKGDTHCLRCGNCVREYHNTRERMRE
jgi:hypothetical protein